MAALRNRLDGRHTLVAIALPSHDDEDDGAVAAARPAIRWQDELYLSRASVHLAESLDEATLRELAVHLPLPYLADWCAMHLVTTTPDGSSAPVVVCAHIDPRQEPRARALWQRTVQVTPRVIPTFTSVLRADERPSAPYLVDVAPNPLTGALPGSSAAHLLARAGLATAVHVPLVSGTHALGVLTLASVTPGRFGPGPVALAVAYANLVAGMLARAQQYRRAVENLRERDVALVEIAHDLQASVSQIAEYAAEAHRSLALLQASEQPEHQTRARRACTQIERSAQSLLGIFADLLAEFGGDVDVEVAAAPRKEQIDLAALARQAVERYRHLAAGHALHFDANHLDQVVGYWNPGALTRILDNLLTNAITFSQPDDTITLRVWRGEARAQAGARKREWAYLQVRDQGVGIPACDLPHVFETFYRGSNVRTTIQGTGIGLSSVRNLVERHGGSVHLASERGAGASITVMLPLDPVPQTGQPTKRTRRRESLTKGARQVIFEAI